MKKESLKNKKLIAIVAVILVIAVVMAVVMPMLLNKPGKNYMYGKADVVKEKGIKQYNTSFGDSFKYLFDSDESTFAISSADGANIFHSHSRAAALNSLATIINLRLRDKKGNSYSMDSTANSVALNGHEIASLDSEHISMMYEFRSEDGSLPDIYMCIAVVFEWKQGSLSVSVDTSSISVPDGMFIEQISILPGLFSVNAGEKNTYYTVPDGCGAVMDVSAVTEKSVVLDMNMYGEDVSFYNYNKGATLPFFAVTRNGFLINTIIEDGDALSRITCKKEAEGGGYLYNTFTITPCGMVDGRFVYGESYKGKISQTYVVKESDSDYNAIAAQLRDSLTERNYLSTTLNGSFSDLPFFINVIGSVDGKASLTTFEDAAEITALLKSRGVRSIALRFSGFSEKGLATVGEKEKDISSQLGGREALARLCEEIKEQGNSIYMDTNILSAKTGSVNKVTVYDEWSRFAGYLPEEFSLVKSKVIDENISSSYTLATSFGGASLCLNDGSRFLYSDLDGKNNRQGVLDKLKNNVSALSASGGLMLDYPAVYLAKQADAVFATPNTASCEGINGVTVVPILQMVLHGGVVYGSMPINVSNLSAEDALLKCVEYGCVPSFLFTHSAETNISYSSYATQTAKLYSKAKQLQPVMNMKITSHEKVTDGVYKITYDYSRTVYVNYNPSLVEVNGVMISAKDFIVI